MIILVGLVVTPLLVRILGSSLYGDYAFLISLLGMTMILVNAGIFDGMRKYMAENRARTNWIEYVFSYYLRISIVFATIAFLTYSMFSWTGYVRYLIGSNFGPYLYLLGILIIARQAFTVTRGGLMGLGLEDRSEPLNVVKSIVFGGIGLSLAYVGYGVKGVLIGHIVASFTAAIIGFIILSRRLDASVMFERLPTGFPRKELLSFNSLSIILTLLTVSLYHIDILLLRPIAGSQDAGYYRAALVLAEFLWFVPTALQTVLLQSSSEIWSSGHTERITELISKSTRYNISFTLLIAVGIAALASDFVPLYFGPEFQASVLPLLLLLPGSVGFAIARPIYAVGQGKGELRILILATGSAALMNLILNLSLIPLYGMAGAAIATSLSYGSMMVFHVVASRKIGVNPLQGIRLQKMIQVLFLSTPIIVGLSYMISSSLLSILIVPPVGFTTYVLLSVRFSVIDSEDISRLISKLPEPIDHYVTRVFDYIQ